MILSGKEIIKQQGKGLEITPFSEAQVNPNSYNLRLHPELLVYNCATLDMRKDNPTRKIEIPAYGLVLDPGILYLGRTVERTRTTKYVPMLEGRSSVGRLGVYIHVTAGFGDVGFDGYWTLELHCVQPVLIYPNVEICQIYYHTVVGDYDLYDSGKYNHNQGVQASRMWMEFQSDKEHQRRTKDDLLREANLPDEETLRRRDGFFDKCNALEVHHELDGSVWMEVQDDKNSL